MQAAQTATSPYYLLLWENDWNKILNKDGFDVELVSESVDKQIPERGHLLLVKLKGAEAGQDKGKADPSQFLSYRSFEFNQFIVG